ncbi:MAG: cyclic nucleotide-binding domain-containing protein [Myxococcota bacterium]
MNTAPSTSQQTTQVDAPAPCSAFDPDVIARTPLFGGMTDECRCVMTDRMQIRQLHGHERLYSQGDTARELYILAHGHLDVFRDGKKLAGLEPGDFFGEVSFLDMQPRGASVVASEESVVYAIPYAALRQLYQVNMRAYALIVMNLAREVCRRLSRAEQGLCSMKP